ncbi:hypothetical protein [Phaffia rhodozyma]|uniref:Uncharacterized protein n=1 Tax=Phaffia rhodozyma TaxID=264483 RepID=A0A0F7SI34_PHARH|nr:hypothetical protein [Phaffia rhodozyma]
MSLKFYAHAHDHDHRRQRRGFQLYDSASSTPSAVITTASVTLPSTGSTTPTALALTTTTAAAITTSGAPPSAALLTSTALTSAQSAIVSSSISTSYANIPPASNDTMTKARITAIETGMSTALLATQEADTSSTTTVIMTQSSSKVKKSSTSSRSSSATTRLSSASSSASTAIANADSSSSTSLGVGSIAGIVAALCVFLLVIGCFFVIRSNARQKRKRAVEAYAPYSDWNNGRGSTFELQDEDSGSTGGMIERKPSWRDQGRPRDMGGPRPPTMIESGRAGMGAIGSLGRVPSTSTPVPQLSKSAQPQTSDTTVPSFSPGQIIQPLFTAGLAPLPPVAISSTYGEPGPNDGTRWEAQGGVGTGMGYPVGAAGYVQQRQQQPSPQHQAYTNGPMYPHSHPLSHSLQPTLSSQQPYPYQNQQPFTVQSTVGQVQMQQPSTNRQTMFNPDDAYGGM